MYKFEKIANYLFHPDGIESCQTDVYFSFFTLQVIITHIAGAVV